MKVLYNIGVGLMVAACVGIAVVLVGCGLALWPPATLISALGVYYGVVIIGVLLAFLGPL